MSMPAKLLFLIAVFAHLAPILGLLFIALAVTLPVVMSA
jgi:hypothetical protein